MFRSARQSSSVDEYGRGLRSPRGAVLFSRRFRSLSALEHEAAELLAGLKHALVFDAYDVEELEQTLTDAIALRGGVAERRQKAREGIIDVSPSRSRSAARS